MAQSRMGRPSIAPRVVEYLQNGTGYGTPSTIAEAIGAHPKSLGRLLRRLVADGTLAQDDETGVYFLASDKQGRALRLGVVVA